MRSNLTIYKCKKEDYLLRQGNYEDLRWMCKEALASFYGFEFDGPTRTPELHRARNHECVYIAGWETTARNFANFTYWYLVYLIRSNFHPETANRIGQYEIRKMQEASKRIIQKVVNCEFFSDEEILENPMLTVVDNYIGTYNPSQKFLSDAKQTYTVFKLLESTDFENEVILFTV